MSLSATDGLVRRLSRASVRVALATALALAGGACAQRHQDAASPGGGLKGAPPVDVVPNVASVGSIDWKKTQAAVRDTTVAALEAPHAGAKQLRGAYDLLRGGVDTVDGRAVHGYVVGTSETFTGFVTSGIFGGGRMEIITSSGLRCAGDYEYATDDHAQGMLRCANGGTGPFQFITTQRNGSSGTGTFGKSIFKFSIG